jgi:hypothetical protein
MPLQLFPAGTSEAAASSLMLEMAGCILLWLVCCILRAICRSAGSTSVGWGSQQLAGLELHPTAAVQYSCSCTFCNISPPAAAGLACPDTLPKLWSITAQSYCAMLCCAVLRASDLGGRQDCWHSMTARVLPCAWVAALVQVTPWWCQQLNPCCEA